MPPPIGLFNFAAGNLLRIPNWLPSALLGSLLLGFALPYVFLAVLNLSQRKTPIELQGRVSAGLTLALFGPRAPTQALGALAIAHATYAEICLVLGLATVGIAIWLGVAGLLSPRR